MSMMNGKKPKSEDDKFIVTAEMRANARKNEMNSRKKALRDRLSPDRAMGTASSISASVQKTANRKLAANPKKIFSPDSMYVNQKKGEAAGKKYLGSLTSGK